MNIKYFLFFQLFIIPTSCAMEPPTTVYNFEIKNYSDSIIVINTETIKYREINSDTLRPGETFNREFIQLGCFKDYSDTLLNTFFKKIEIIICSDSLKIYPYQRKNWKDSLNLNGLLFCKGGKASYKLYLN